jgi:putative transposase
MKEEFNFEEIKEKTLEQLKSGKSLLGKDGAFAPLLENILNAALEGEMDSHMNSEERSRGNRRNGYTPKQVQTPLGEVTVHTPREISDWMQENLGNRVSADTISSITDRVLPEIQSWRSPPLEDVYAIVWMDAIHYKVMDEKNRPVTRAIYNIIGINPEGYKELLGMYISKSEGANFWLSSLTDIQSRGVKDILIACTDNLTGFSDAINSVFPQTTVQTCIVHQIRNSIK